MVKSVFGGVIYGSSDGYDNKIIVRDVGGGHSINIIIYSFLKFYDQ
jgi:hypothetical protein